MFPFFSTEPSFAFQAKDVIDLLALVLPDDGRILELGQHIPCQKAYIMVIRRINNRNQGLLKKGLKGSNPKFLNDGRIFFSVL
jgi:hypothetical protein